MNRLGALPFFFIKRPSATLSGLCNALACGVMIAASFDLVNEGHEYDGPMTIVGLVLGAAFVYYTQKHFTQSEDLKFFDLKGMNAHKAIMIIGIMTLHSIGEGAGVGVSFAGGRGWTKGTLMALAIGVHNIPEGLAIAMVLVSRGVSATRAMWWCIFTSVPQPIVAVLAFIFVHTFRTYLPFSLGFAAGCMLYVVFAELLPDALKDVPSQFLAVATTASVALLELFRMALEYLDAAAHDGSSFSFTTHTAYGNKVLVNWVTVSLYALAVGTLATVMGVLFATIVRKKFASLSVIKVLIMVYAAAFVSAVGARDFATCHRFYSQRGIGWTSTIFFMMVGFFISCTVTLLKVFGSNADTVLPQDSLASPKKSKKGSGSSTDVPTYIVTSLAIWSFSLGLHFSALGIHQFKSVSLDIFKVFFAAALATLALASNKLKEGLGLYAGGLAVGAALLVGAFFASFMEKGSSGNIVLHAVSLGAVFAFFAFAIRAIESKRSFSSASMKYWLFVLSSVLAGLISGVVFAFIQSMVVTTKNTYVMSFC